MFVPGIARSRDKRDAMLVDYTETPHELSLATIVEGLTHDKELAARANTLDSGYGNRAKVDNWNERKVRLAIQCMEAVVTGMCKRMAGRSFTELITRLAQRLGGATERHDVAAEHHKLVATAAMVVRNNAPGSTARRTALAISSPLGLKRIKEVCETQTGTATKVVTGRIEVRRAREDLLTLSLGVSLEPTMHTRQKFPTEVIQQVVDFVLAHVGSLSWGSTSRDVDGNWIHDQPLLVRLQRKEALWQAYRTHACGNKAEKDHRGGACGKHHVGRTVFLGIAGKITDCDDQRLTALDSDLQRYVRVLLVCCRAPAHLT